MELILAIVGDRFYTDWQFFEKTVSDELQRFPATRIITGDSTGVDTMALEYALMRGMKYQVFCANKINYTRMRKDGINAVLVADWDTHGRAAGPIRNKFMMFEAHRILLFDGGGKGSRSVKKLAIQMGKDLERWEITPYRGVEETARPESMTV